MCSAGQMTLQTIGGSTLPRASIAGIHSPHRKRVPVGAELVRPAAKLAHMALFIRSIKGRYVTRITVADGGFANPQYDDKPQNQGGTDDYGNFAKHGRLLVGTGNASILRQGSRKR